MGIHYVDTQQKKRVSEILAIKVAPAGHTAAFTRRITRQILDEYGIPEETVFAATTDNGSDVKCAFNSEETRDGEHHFDWYWAPCSSHTLALAVNDIFEPSNKTKEGNERAFLVLFRKRIML